MELIPPYCVFSIPYRYLGKLPEIKRFVCIFHEPEIAICVKATSKTTIYDNSPSMKAGVVYYLAGELSFFTLNTAIQPDNLHPIRHCDITACHAQGSLTILGNMPPDFRARLRAAVNASITMKPVRKQSILTRL